jgi:hypothetical protein
MGNQVSSQSENKKIEPFKEKEIESANIVRKDTFSSYKGLKTELSDQPNKETIDTNTSDSMTIDNNKAETNLKPEEPKVSTVFEWREGGNAAYVTGSFSGWTQWFVMNKNPTTNYFELTLVNY